MRLLRLLSVASDLSETSLEEATKLYAENPQWFLIVGTKQAEAARRLQRLVPNGISNILVNPEWTHEWAVTTSYGGVFSEGVYL